MYQGVQTQNSCARAWIAACNSIIGTNDEGYNVVIDIKHPSTHDEEDNQVIMKVDRFLREHDENPISTVSNTIFPQSLLDAHGPDQFYTKYHEAYDALSPKLRRWGRYFERLTRHKTVEHGEYNPLQCMIDKMKNSNGYKSVYELAVYDPLLDRRYLRGGQCLSYLSFKIHPTDGLLLTGLYRNHTYITRCLGNLIGLGRLQKFVADEAGIGVGSLTIVSTHATIDAGSWGLKSARKLVHQAAKIATCDTV